MHVETIEGRNGIGYQKCVLPLYRDDKWPKDGTPTGRTRRFF
jgi:hypothetical protein